MCSRSASASVTAAAVGTEVCPLTPNPSPPEGRGEQRVIPHIRGNAYVTAESTLLLDDADPFQWGIRG